MNRKLHYYFCALFICLCAGLNAQTGVTLIPDSNFEQRLIDLGYDDVLDGEVLTSSIDGITFLTLGNAGISDLSGIEDFTSLTEFYCNLNNLTSVDLSTLTNLEKLFIYGNDLSALDISNNTALQYLACSDNNLSSLDISSCANLVWLVAENNSLTALEVSNNSALETLFLNGNNLSSLDVSNNNLSQLNINGNSITTLDLSNSINLYRLYCNGNGLQALDVSNNPNLDWLYCNNNNLTELDLSNNNLGRLYCSNNSIDVLDISTCTDLGWLDCSYNNLTALDVSNNIEHMNHFTCDYNNISSLDFSNSENIISFISAANNNLNEVNLTNVDLGGLYNLKFTDNPDLNCVLIDEGETINPIFLHIDEQTELSPECTALSVSEVDFEAVSIVNPVKDVLVIQHPESIEIYEVSIYNVSGQEILHASSNEIDFSAFSNGLYMAKIVTNKGTLVKKILK